MTDPTSHEATFGVTVRDYTGTIPGLLRHAAQRDPGSEWLRTDDLSLNRAVGHIAGTALPGDSGNVGIAGHRDGFFRGLKDIVTGDTIEITTQAKTDTYVIDQITIVNPSDVSVLAPRSQPSVTLVTCYPFYFVGSAPQRYIVQASLKNADEKNPDATKNAKF